MGTGKSTIGEYLSLEKQLSFIDLDIYIEIRENKTIPDIFKDIGEIGFRELEYKYLSECTQKYDVIATGGGIIEYSKSLNYLKQYKYIFWLDCDIDIIFKRVLNDKHRPNAIDKSKKQLNNLYLSRISRYNEIAFMKVNSDKTIKEIYNDIINYLSCG
ncbi:MULTISPECIES: shikimate kinase [Staphylococcus]|nr:MULTISPECIES: shikimate kinase [unclassified Staphylococcus]OHR85108.1 shikimate kinase [Staphylococcus sp. HMSC34C02]